MRTTVIAIFAAFALWAGYWFYGQSVHAQATETWFNAQRDEGWIAEYGEIDVKGFPNRFDTVIDGLFLSDPKTGWAWEAPEFELLSLSYRPNHVIASFPPKHSIRTPNQTITVTNDELQGSAVFETRGEYELNRSNFIVKALSLQGFAGDPVTVQDGQIATRVTGNEGRSHDIAVNLKNVDLGRQVLAILKGTGDLPEELEQISFLANATFDGVWDLPSLSGSGPDLRALDVEELRLDWADLRLRATGPLEVDRFGYPSGSLQLRAENWEQMVEISVANRWLPRELESTVIAALQLVARLSGNPDELEVKVSFSNKTAYIGPVPIGEAPRIWPVQRQ